MDTICEKMAELMSRSLDGEISAADERALQAHLKECPSCRRLRGEYAEVTRLIQAETAPAASEVASERIRESVYSSAVSGKTPAVSRRFRVLALAAAFVLAVLLGIVANALIDVRGENARLRAMRPRPAERVVVLPDVATLVQARANGGNGVAANLRAFAVIKDYVGGRLKWMATDGDQVEIGYSSAGGRGMPASDSAAERYIVLQFQYVVQRGGGRPVVVSRPQFVLASGQEASVRLHGSSHHSARVFHYRVKAVLEQDGRIRTGVEFTPDAGVAAGSTGGVRGKIAAEALVREKKAVLIGERGDENYREALYLWAAVRSIPSNTKISGNNGTESL